jgi:hypothetical protein
MAEKAAAGVRTVIHLKRAKGRSSERLFAITEDKAVAVFRVEKTCDYTVMANHHLKNRSLTLKAKGLLSMILSLPDEWNYTTRGLAAICREGVDSIGGALRELEQEGYIVRNQLRDEKGRITDTEYVIYEQPRQPDTASPYADNPYTGNPYMDKPDTENPAQLNTYRERTKRVNTQKSIPNQSNPISQKQQESGKDGTGRDEMEGYRELIQENIDYAGLLEDNPNWRERLDEIVELMAETLCSKRNILTVAGDDFPAAAVKRKLLKIGSQHMEYIFECLNRNTTDVRNIKKYLLAVLFNAPSTMTSFYKTQFNHDIEKG